MSNIIKFPNMGDAPANTNKVDEDLDRLLYEADELAEEWIEYLSAGLDEAEISEMSNEYWKDLHHAAEALRSLIYRHKGILHPFQQFVDKTIMLKYENGSVLAYWDEDAFNEDE